MCRARKIQEAQAATLLDTACSLLNQEARFAIITTTSSLHVQPLNSSHFQRGGAAPDILHASLYFRKIGFVTPPPHTHQPLFLLFFLWGGLFFGCWSQAGKERTATASGQMQGVNQRGEERLQKREREIAREERRARAKAHCEQ